LFYQSKKGDLFALPSTVGSKRASLEGRLIAAEAKGEVTSSTVGRNLQAIGLGSGGVVAQYKQMLEATETPKTDSVSFASAPEQTEVGKYFASLSPQNLSQYKRDEEGNYVYYKVGNLYSPLPPGPSQVNTGTQANFKDIGARASFEKLNPLEKATVTAEATLFSPKSFELIGASVTGNRDLSTQIIGEYVQKRQTETQTSKEGAFKQAGDVFITSFKDTRTLAGTTAQGVALGYAIPAAVGIAGTTGAVGLTGGYSYFAAKAQGADEADSLKAGILGGATAGAFTKIQALAATNPNLAKGATQALTAGLLGFAGYAGGEAAAKEGKDVKVGQVGGIAQATTFLVGAGAGGKFAKDNPFPIKTETVRVPVGTQKTSQTDATGKTSSVEVPTYKEAYKALTYQGRSGKSYPLAGRTETGKILVGKYPTAEQTPSIQAFKTLGPKGYVVIESGLEAGYYSQEPVLKAAGFSPEAAKATQAGISLAYKVQGTQSAFTLNKLPETTKSAGRDVQLAVKFLQGKVQKYQGSFAQRSQQKSEFRGYEPADIDPILKTTSAQEASKIAKDLTAYLNKQTIEGNKYAIDPSKPTLIVNKDTGVHAFDIHYQGQPLDYTLGAQPQSDKAFGISINQPTRTIEGQPVQSLTEQSTRKLASAFTLRSETTARKVPGPGPETYRAKDIVDVYPNVETILSSKELYGANVAGARAQLGTVMSYFTKTGQVTQADFASRGLKFEYYPEGKPVSITPLSPGASGAAVAKASTFRLALASQYASPARSASRPSTYRQPASSSSSFSALSPSPSKYPSAYSISPSPSPSPSKYSPSPSPSPSPSVSSYAYSPSSSASAYKSPSPSTYKSPSPSTYGYASGYRFGSGGFAGASPSSGGFTGKTFKSFGLKGKKVKGRIPDLFSIGLTQKTTGRTTFITPSTKRIEKSKLFKRSGGFLAPTGEQLKGLGKTPYRLGKFF
jgi:hypothetical protein